MEREVEHLENLADGETRLQNLAGRSVEPRLVRPHGTRNNGFGRFRGGTRRRATGSDWTQEAQRGTGSF
jgi:hypothetical protein